LIGSGFEVTLLDPSASPIAALLPVGLSEELRQALAHHGVVWHFGTTVQRGSITTATPGPVQAKKQKLLHLPRANAPAGAAVSRHTISLLCQRTCRPCRAGFIYRQETP
jgi:hypothetical protein